MPRDLSRETLAALPATIARPRFDPASVSRGIVHLGFGGFHRAHMARYTHDLMERRVDAAKWGIVGVGTLLADVRVRDALAAQDALYTLVERQDGDETATVIGSVCEVIFAGESSQAALGAIDDPAIRIVSLTVTENGYCRNAATRTLDREHPSIVHDLAHPDRPRSAVGILVEAYRRRMAARAPAFTALTCDNIQHNGVVLRDAVLALAGWRDHALAEWIAANASFPSTMVDRITPVTTPAQIKDFTARFDLVDRWPIFCERFRQWVIEDSFVAGRPAWEEVGAQFVADVAPYEFMKLRLLNASHLAIAGLGFGTVMPSVIKAVIGGVAPKHAGLASGIVISTFQIASALGVAVMGGVFYTELGAGRGAAAFGHAFAVALGCNVVLLVVGGVLSLFLPDQRHALAKATSTKASRG